MKHINLDPQESLCLKNVACLLTCQGTSQNPLGLQRNMDVLIENGLIRAVGPSLNIPGSVKTLDCSQFLCLPALMDVHAHPIFSGSRAREMLLKLQGKSYQEIAAAGGGIRASMQATRLASEDALAQSLNHYCEQAHRQGIAVQEVKTGYGLQELEELRLFRIVVETAIENKKAKRALPLIVPTLLAPHSASPEHSSHGDYIEALVQTLTQYNALREQFLREFPGINPAVDIFIEDGYFNSSHGERWLSAALKLGFHAHLHAEEFGASGGCETAIRVASTPPSKGSGRVLSTDHCQHASLEQLKKLAQLNVTAVALPTTSFYSNIPYVDGNMWQASGVRVAVGSDFNPGSSPLQNLWLSAYLALSKSGFSLETTILSVTKNAAAALDVQEHFGSIEVGKAAQLLLLDGHEPEDFFLTIDGSHLRHFISRVL